MKDRNGISFVTAAEVYKHAMAKKEGCDTGKCPPLGKSTSSHAQMVTGVTLGKYR